MYLITSERESSKKNEIENRVFGIKLYSSKNIEYCLRYLDLEELISDTNFHKLFLEILKENSIERVLYQERIEQARRKFRNEKDFEFPLLSDTVLNYIGFPKIKDILTTNDKEYLLKLARRYFDKNKKKLKIIYYISEYMEAFREIDYKLIQSTEEKVIVTKRNDPFNLLFGNISSIRYNTLILMLLTGKTTFINLNGEEEPIILDGHIRTEPTCVQLPKYEDEPIYRYLKLEQK